MRPETKFHHGDRVRVYDYGGHLLFIGHVVGINRDMPARYDIDPEPEDHRSPRTLKNRVPNIEESRLRLAGRPALSYDRSGALPPVVRPVMVRDEV